MITLPGINVTSLVDFFTSSSKTTETIPATLPSDSTEQKNLPVVDLMPAKIISLPRYSKELSTGQKSR